MYLSPGEFHHRGGFSCSRRLSLCPVPEAIRSLLCFYECVANGTRCQRRGKCLLVDGGAAVENRRDGRLIIVDHLGERSVHEGRVVEKGSGNHAFSEISGDQAAGLFFLSDESSGSAGRQVIGAGQTYRD